MLSVTALVVIDIVLRLRAGDAAVAPAAVVVLSVIAGLLVIFGTAYGGSLVYDYGFNVEMAGPIRAARFCASAQCRRVSAGQ